MALGILLNWKEAKGLDNRYCVRFMQFEIGLLRHFLLNVFQEIRVRPIK